MAGMMPTYDYETEQAELLRRMKVAEAMQSGGLAPLGPTEFVGGHAVKKSPLEVLAKVAQAYVGNKMGQGIQDQQRALGERYRADGKAGLQSLIDALSAAPGNPTAVNDESGGHTGPAMTAADAQKTKMRGIIEAMGSNHPMLQNIGGTYLQSVLKDKTQAPLDLKELAERATPESVLANPTDPTKWVAKRNLKSVQAGEVTIDDAGNITTPGPMGGASSPDGAGPGTVKPGVPSSAGPSGPGWSTIEIKGDTYQITSTGLKKLDNAPKVTTNVKVPVNVVQAGQKVGFEEWSKLSAKTVAELNDSARQSTKLLSQLTQLEGLTAGGTNAGPTADIATFVQGLANTAGIPVDASKLNNSAAFNSVATQAWAALMQQNGGARGLVREESEKLAKSLPSLMQTPQGRKQITAVLRQQAQQNIEDARRANAEYGAALQAQDPAKFTFGLSNTQMPQSGPLPTAPGAVTPGGKKPTVSNW